MSSSSDPVKRLLRFMTHVNIGATLGLLAWLLWSGWQVVSGQWQPAYRSAEVRALMQMAHASHPAPTSRMHLVPVGADGALQPPCPGPVPAAQAALPTSGADL